VPLGPVADQATRPKACKVDTDRDAVGDIGIDIVGQALARMQRTQRLDIEQALTASKPDLRQP
jgi:hypothetical protein